MRRREKAQPDAGAPPARLLRYDPRDWARGACHPECAFWDARAQWIDEHPDYDGPMDATDGPDAPFHPEDL